MELLATLRRPRPALSPFAWGLAGRLAAAAVLAAGLWLAVAWALDWWG